MVRLSLTVVPVPRVPSALPVCTCISLCIHMYVHLCLFFDIYNVCVYICIYIYTGNPIPEYCLPGTYCVAGGKPVDCPKYTYSTLRGATSISDCISCPAGYFCDALGISVLSTYACPVGNFCYNGTTLPIPCPAGSYRYIYIYMYIYI
jgi:hypothetical protein